MRLRLNYGGVADGRETSVVMASRGYDVNLDGGTRRLLPFSFTPRLDCIMSGIRETRKNLQLSVLFIVQCEKADAALRELTLLKQTVDSQIRLLSEKLNLLEDCEYAADSQETLQQHNEESYVAQAVKEGFSGLTTGG